MIILLTELLWVLPPALVCVPKSRFFPHFLATKCLLGEGRCQKRLSQEAASVFRVSWPFCHCHSTPEHWITSLSPWCFLTIASFWTSSSLYKSSQRSLAELEFETFTPTRTVWLLCVVIQERYREIYPSWKKKLKWMLAGWFQISYFWTSKKTHQLWKS